MPSNHKTRSADKIKLTLHEVDEDIKHVAAAFKARLTKRKNKGPKALGERPMEFENKNAAMDNWVDAFEYLREFLGAKHHVGDEEP